MNGFIEVTDVAKGKFLQSVRGINYIWTDDRGYTFICTGIDEEGNEVGVYVMESYEEIKAQLLG